MRIKIIVAVTLLAASAGVTFRLAADRKTPAALPNTVTASGAKMLPNGWKVTPAGRHLRLPGDLPLRMIVTRDGKRLLVNTGGWHDHGITAINLETEKVMQTVDLAKNWDGMTMDPASGDIFVSGGGPLVKTFNPGNAAPLVLEGLKKPVLRLKFANDRLEVVPALSIEGLSEENRFISGLTLSPAGSLFVLNTETDTLYRMRGEGYKIQSALKVGYRPYAAVVSPDTKHLAVSNWGDESVSLIDAESLKETARIKTGSQPNDMVWSKDNRLFVANAGSNTVSVLQNGKVTETIRTSLDAKAPVGSTPDALVLSPDQKRLFVANADNNDVAVIDVSNAEESRVLGFIPTGWYPSSLAISPDGRKLYIGTAKGLDFAANYPPKTKYLRPFPNPKQPYDYIGGVLTGSISVVDLPDAPQLAAYTKQVYANVPVPATQFDSAFAKRIETNVFPKIKHVVYIIRENRTYDQVLGDLEVGNGDPSIAIFGRNVTPNAHALAKQYVTLDNLYCNGEVSEDGHQWSDAAYATHFTERAWMSKYSKRGEPEHDERLTASPAGYIWDNCQRHGVSYRTYGEMSNFTSDPEHGPVFRATTSLKGHTSNAWLKLKGRETRDTDRAKVFIDEMHQAESKNDWPQFMIMSLGEDHTEGLLLGKFTPVAHVASNDQAVAQIVEAVSKSKFWSETAIFIIEDDAQNGPDHVDAHRTVGLVISPYVKRGVVDSTLYSTASFLKTMELILGLPPMTQFDTLATPMYNTFTETALLASYTPRQAEVDLSARNLVDGPGPVASRKLDFSEYDRADPDALNEILWAALRPNQKMPAPVRSIRR
jgi:YVTN family beta-propeller protein